MKKKFLSLMMAAAVVATTSVSAFANTRDYDNVAEDQDINHEVTITGDVENKDGHVKPGTLSVTVPTTATFRVKRNGDFQGSTLEVRNRGTQTIEVYVNEFIDTDGQENVNVVSESKTSGDTVNRKHVSLNIKGNNGIAYLGTAAGDAGKGVYSDKNLSDGVADGKKVSEITAGNTDTLTLGGRAGQKTEEITEPVKNAFTLKLAIRKKAANKTPNETSEETSDGIDKE